MDKHQIYQHQGMGGTSGIGQRCGLVLVDFVNGFVDVDQLGGPHIEQAAQRAHHRCPQVQEADDADHER